MGHLIDLNARTQPAQPDPDAEARRTLRRHRAFATALLVLMAALTLGSYALPASTATDLLQAASKAGFVLSLIHI